MKSGSSCRRFIGSLVFTTLVGFVSHASAADLSLPITGTLLGSVVNSHGTAQMGATVELFNKFDRLIAKTYSAADGRFAFDSLPADFYTVRVSLASYLPVSRDNIAVKAGTDSVLHIHLATLISSIEISYAVPTAAMTDDWKWVLRSAPSIRPVTRLTGGDDTATSNTQHPRVFSETHAALLLSGGDSGLLDSESMTGDLGTGFALSTNIFGKNQLQVGGIVGENGTGLNPSQLGFYAVYNRNDDTLWGSSPEVTVAVSQLNLMGGQLPEAPAIQSRYGTSSPSVRTMSVTIYQTIDPISNVHMEYGATAESVDYVQGTSRVSPFARTTVDLGKRGKLIAAYSNGGQPDALLAHGMARKNELDDVPGNLSESAAVFRRLPQLAFGNGHIALERTQNYEVGYQKRAGSRIYAVSAFHENVFNGRINVTGDLASLDASDLLSDGISKTSIYDIGHYNRNGYLASVSQRVNDSLNLAVAYGRMGALQTSTADLSANWGIDKFVPVKDTDIAALNLSAKVPFTGTQIASSYGWVNGWAYLPCHMFTTQNISAQPGLNFFVRQPLPSFFGIPGRMELTADLRNLLAQGYLPLGTADGHRFLVVQSPRAIRGGLNFIF